MFVSCLQAIRNPLLGSQKNMEDFNYLSQADKTLEVDSTGNFVSFLIFI